MGYLMCKRSSTKHTSGTSLFSLFQEYHKPCSFVGFGDFSKGTLTRGLIHAIIGTDEDEPASLARTQPGKEDKNGIIQMLPNRPSLSAYG